MRPEKERKKDIVSRGGVADVFVPQSKEWLWSGRAHIRVPRNKNA